MQKKIKQRGVSLLEVLLALAIASLAIIMAIRFYQTLNRDKEFQVLQYNVNTLFISLGNYYHAQCYGTSNPGNSLYPSTDAPVNFGTLNPNNPNFANPLVLDINKDFQQPGYLSRPLSFTRLVDNSIKMPYAVQFIESTQDKTMGTCQNYKSDGTCDTTTQTKVATIVIWTAQVAAKLPANVASNPNTAKTYALILNAKCLATQAEITAGVACSGGFGAGEFVVWQRMPTSPATKGEITDFNEMNPNVSQFTQMYTTYPDLYLKSLQSSSNSDLPDGTRQYIYCGN